MRYKAFFAKLANIQTVFWVTVLLIDHLLNQAGKMDQWGSHLHKSIKWPNWSQVLIDNQNDLEECTGQPKQTIKLAQIAPEDENEDKCEDECEDGF